MQITYTVQNWLQKKYQDRMKSYLHILLQVSQWYHFILLCIGDLLKITCHALSLKKGNIWYINV